MMEKYVVIDLETTGHSPAKGDKIIEVGIVIIENDEIIDEYTTFLNPGKPIPTFVANLTGISDNDVVHAPTFAQQAEQIVNIMRNGYIIAHNVPFDLGFLNAELESIGMETLMNPVLDTVELSRILYPQAPGFKLGQLAEYLHITHNEPHRALSDAYVTAKLFLKLKQKLWKLPYETIVHLSRLERFMKSDLYEMLYQCQETVRYRKTAEPNIVSFQGLAFLKKDTYVRGNVTISESYGDYLDNIYESQGTLNIHMPNYEKRDGQRDMSETIFDAFQRNTHALIEAETGTGKTLAYLIPAIYEAVKNEQRIVISTYTTQLQAQLLHQEVPLIRKLIPFPFHIALLKGKQHYISLEKLHRELRQEQQDNYDIALTKAMILVWLTETETGDLEEIHLPSGGFLFAKKVTADSEYVSDSRSPWSAYSFYQSALSKARQADIILTNHALLCTDLFSKNQFLPSYEKIIIDEAHQLEETAAHHYGLKMDYVNMMYMLNQIGSTKDSNWLGRMFHKSPASIAEVLKEWDHVFANAKYETDELFRTLFQCALKLHKQNAPLSDIGRIQCRLKDMDRLAEWPVIIEMTSRLIFFLQDLKNMLAKMVDDTQLDMYEKEEINRFIQMLETITVNLKHLFLVEETDKEVKWIEIEASGAKNAVYLYSEPTDISSLLAKDFFAVKQSVILTSATLTMKNKFEFIQERLGITDGQVITKQINSPFSYEDQVQLLIPNDFPDIKYGNTDDYIYATCEAILSLAEITKGRMLVLFTAYDMLKQAHAILKEAMDNDQYMLIGQGITSGSRERLKKSFQTFEKAILLGTSSFWEGVDLPGQSLSCLIIVRLPFQPPNHPIFEAKAKVLEREGKNAFMDLALPSAVIRFKQGFGRLIRSTNDRGIVFICDTRIKRARYGKYFTASIPNVPIHFDSTSALMKTARDWF